LRPFTFFETKRFYRDYTPYDLAVLYGVTGGVPAYIELMDPARTLSENIEAAFFTPSAPLLGEPGNMLRREVRDPAYYNAVLRTIAAGFCKNTDIAEEVGLETSACTAYLKNLIAMRYVNKYTPITEKVGRKTLYEIADNMLRFWYKFIPENISMIQSGMTGRIWRSVAQGIPSFMADVFAEICRQWLEQQNAAGRLPINFIELGRWWGYDTVWKTEAQISILAYEGDDNAIFGDCVWSDEPAGADKLVTLMERSRLFRYSNRHYYLFSRSGFSDECAETAARIGASLVMFE
jgi:AAA+ ATPase superfamily predicted ATPase